MPEPHLRAGDADRTATADLLGKHMAAGRLTLDEYDERLARAYAAKTYGELAELTADLPSARPAATPAPATRPPTAPRPHPVAMRSCGGSPWSRPGHRDLAHAWRAWLTTSITVLAIYVMTGVIGGFGYPWPVWVIGPWGLVLLAQTSAQRLGLDGDRGRQLGS
ncbi:DUF1707 domain-containing protein [Geodermatophilus sp. YIM 151500]|uniref:DUF1707 SHOCT-like domain-containing protein n=1 Tax=Geodermatophilus sp. YIM 151500 TaxID=2984531 RepID=UPI0021E365CF|nr:DUF1707 domain-containing protein [Geodermatophilus sp. YIM 151500]MCV2491227.1 DUF1707 domain-containing protein [Geodermatophilus sp. YIM 151500]